MRIGCVFRGHHYYPSFHHRYKQEAWYLARKEETFTYECCDCDTPFVVKGKAAHKEFLAAKCPSWGGRGSDSQGYKSDTENSAGE
jgi:hypothetical protein